MLIISMGPGLPMGWAVGVFLAGILLGELPALLGNLLLPSTVREPSLGSMLWNMVWLGGLLLNFQLLAGLIMAWPHRHRAGGLWPAFLQAMRSGGIGAGGGGGLAGAGQPGGTGTFVPGQDRFTSVSRAVQGLPTQVYHSREELTALPARELKALLRRAHIDPGPGACEKPELVAALVERADTSSQQCSVCCEDYVPGDVLRVLPRCRHKFHLECIDRWFLTAAEGNRDLACPICNAALEVGR